MLRNRQNKAAATYDKVAELQCEIIDRNLERLPLLKIKPKVILDLGCGTGYASRNLKRQFPKAKIISMDISLGMLQKVRQRKRWFEKQSLLCADAHYFPFKKNSIDLIFCSLLLHQMEMNERVFADWCQSLTDSGVMVMAAYGLDTLDELQNAFAGLDEYAHVDRFLDIHELGNTMMRAGFNAPVLDIDHFQLLYDSPQDYFREIKMVGEQCVHLERLRGCLGKNKYHQLLANLEKTKTEDHKYPLHFEVIYAHAWTKKISARARSDANEFAIPVSVVRRK